MDTRSRLAGPSRLALATLWLTATVALTACGQTDASSTATQTPATDMLSKQELETLNHKKIYFMHHSVGDDIIKGIELLSAKHETPVNIIPLNGEATHLIIPEPGFAHARGGKNQYPDSKIAAFTSQIARFDEEGRPDIAFMKFCFVDFNPETDVNALFKRYTEAVDQLEKAYPDIRFIHLTVPLKARPSSWKDRLNRLLGRMVWEDDSNLLREKYNRLLRVRYPADRVFDIALYESTRPDGSREIQHKGDEQFYSLVPDYTYDGGHLNDTGKQVVAAQLVRYLNEIIR